MNDGDSSLLSTHQLNGETEAEEEGEQSIELPVDEELNGIPHNAIDCRCW